MRFYHKLAAAIVLPVCLVLSVGGTWSIHQNFCQALDTVTQNHAADQLHRRYELETRLSSVEDDNSNALFSELTYYAEEEHSLGNAESWFAVVDENGTVFYSGLPRTISYQMQQQAVAAEEQRALYDIEEGKTYQLLCTQLRGLSRPMWLVTARDVSPQFSERDRQARQHFVLEGVVLILAAIAAYIVAKLLTMPLRKLEIASKALSQGDLKVRTRIESGDELEHLGQTFNDMAQAIGGQMKALQEESARQKRFVAAFTHELKTPMTAILGYANMLRSGEQPAEKRHRAADYIYHESSRLESLSREMLLLFELERTPVAMKNIKLSAVWGELRRSLPELQPRLRFEGEDATLRANPELLVTLLRNLILNAAAADARQGEIRVWCAPAQDGLRIGVTDAGPGIPEAEQKRILEPFYRMDKSRSRESGGNGLGLTICEQIAQVHGTHLQIESRPGQGSSLWIVVQEGKE